MSVTSGLFGREMLADPYPVYHWLRSSAPVFWAEPLKAWVLTRYDDVAAVLRDGARFSSQRLGARTENFGRPELLGRPELESMLRMRSEAMLDTDAPKHTRLRSLVSKAFTPKAVEAMKAAHFGRIVLISSRAALGLAKRTAYAATKAGMLGLARTWSLELAPDGITVNVVAPGPIQDTEIFDTAVEKGSARRAALAQSIPVRRLGLPADVARAVLFFTDPEAGFVTGQTLYVCGGASVGSLTL